MSRMLAERDLIKQGLPIVEAVARRLARRLYGCVQLDDLIGMGHVALIEIARTYDPARSSFDIYASFKIKWAMLDGARREARSRGAEARTRAVIASERFGEGAEPQSDELTTLEQDQGSLRSFLGGKATAMALALLVSPDDPVLRTHESETPEDRVARAETYDAARAAVSALPERERILVERHYFGGEPFDAIARDLGISKSWASRLHDRAITALHQALSDAA